MPNRLTEQRKTLPNVLMRRRTERFDQPVSLPDAEERIIKDQTDCDNPPPRKLVRHKTAPSNAAVAQEAEKAAAALRSLLHDIDLDDDDEDSSDRNICGANGAADGERSQEGSVLPGDKSCLSQVASVPETSKIDQVRPESARSTRGFVSPPASSLQWQRGAPEEFVSGAAPHGRASFSWPADGPLPSYALPRGDGKRYGKTAQNPSS